MTFICLPLLSQVNRKQHAPSLATLHFVLTLSLARDLAELVVNLH